MNKFNVAKYNEKINTLNKIIDTFNDTISNFSCWMDITPALVKELIYNPVKTHHKYLSFEKIVQYRCSEYEIEENVVVKERTFFGKFLLRYLKDIIKVLFAVLFWILAGIGVFSVCYPAIRAELLLALSDVLGFVNFGG